MKEEVIYKELLAWADAAGNARVAAEAIGELAGLLERHQGPLRVGACTVTGPVPLPPVGEGFEVVEVSWPVVGSEADVVLLAWGPSCVVEAAAWARTRAPGPHFHPVELEWLRSASAEEVVRELRTIDPGRARSARLQRLVAEVARLRDRHPGLGIPRLVAPHHKMPPRIALIGPDAVRREAWRERAASLGEIVTPHSPTDLALAVAPSGGWLPEHRGTLTEARRRAGRLVVTAPVPESWRLGALLVDEKITFGGLASAAKPLLDSPPYAVAFRHPAPAAPGVRERMLRRRLRVVRGLGGRGLRQLGRSLGIAPSVGLWAIALEVLVVAGLIGAGLARAGLWWPVAAAVAAAMGGARAVTSLRLRRRELRQEVLAEVAFRSGCAKP